MLNGKRLRITAALCLLAALGGCFKDVSYDTSYVLIPSTSFTRARSSAFP